MLHTKWYARNQYMPEVPIRHCKSGMCAQVHSHTYDTIEIPAAKITYDLSPIQILVSEKSRAWWECSQTWYAMLFVHKIFIGLCRSLQSLHFESLEASLWCRSTLQSSLVCLNFNCQDQENVETELPCSSVWTCKAFNHQWLILFTIFLGMQHVGAKVCYSSCVKHQYVLTSCSTWVILTGCCIYI